LMSGQIDFLENDVAQELPLLPTHQVKLLALTSKDRSPDTPDVPTVAELAAADVPELKGFKYDIWYGFFAPARTPKEIIDRLNKELVAALHDPEVRARLLKVGYRDNQIGGMSVDEFKTFVFGEVERWEKVARDSKISPQ